MDRIASNIQSKNKRLALAIDRISDQLEKKAYYPMGWSPGKNIYTEPYGPGRRFGPGKGYGPGLGMGWDPGRRTPYQKLGPGPGPFGTCVCTECGHTMNHTRNTPCLEIKCPQCGGKMDRPERL